MRSHATPATPGRFRRLGAGLRATLSGLVGDRQRSRRSSYLIRGQGGDGETRVVGGNSGNT
jgi:hypothetical protein